MGNGRKKGSTKGALKPAPSLHCGEEGLTAAEDSHGSHQQEQVSPHAPFPYNVEAAPFADIKNKTTLDGESSSFLRPKKASSVPCRFFQRGYCRNGDFCRFQHLEAASASAEPLHSTAKVPPNMRPKAPSVKSRAPSEKSCPPEVCLDWHLTASCPRYRTCRYAHPLNCDVEGSRKNMESGMHMDSGMGLGGFEYMAAQIMRHGLIGSRGGRGNDEMPQRMRNGGFTDDDIYELSLQGIKPWDPEAMDALAVLNGWDMDGGYDSDDYGYDDVFGF